MQLKNKISVLLFISFLLSSCASKEDRQFSESSDSKVDMIESFDLNNKNFEKFKVVEYKKVEEKKKPTKEKDKASKKTVKKTSKAKKIKTKEKVIKVSQKKNVKKVTKEKKTKEVTVESQIPEDFPKEYAAYDVKSAKVWDKFQSNFYANEKFIMSISYLGITAGHISLETKPQVLVSGRKAFHFTGRMKSATFYEYIYTLNDTLETYVDSETFLPVKYTLRQRESGQKVDDLQVFDHKKKKTFFWYHRLKKGKEKKEEKESYIPKYFQDSFSALYFVRGLPLKIGDKYEFPVVTRAKMWLLKMTVDKIEKIKIQGEWVEAIKIKAVTHFPGVLKKKGDINFWYSADKLRKLLKFNAKVKIGTIEGEMIEYKKDDARITYLNNQKTDSVQ